MRATRSFDFMMIDSVVIPQLKAALSWIDLLIKEVVDVEEIAKRRNAADDKPKRSLITAGSSNSHFSPTASAQLSCRASDGWNIELVVLFGVFASKNKGFNPFFHLELRTRAESSEVGVGS